MALVFTGLLLWCRFTFGQEPLQRYYTPAYFRSAVGAQFKKQDKYRLLSVGDGRKPGHLAQPAEVINGSTTTPEGRTLPLELSPAAVTHGLRGLYRGPEMKYQDLALHSYLAATVYEGNSLLDIYTTPLLCATSPYS